MREIIGFDNGDSILAPGGTISNMYGLLCARHKHFPEYKEKGAATFLEEPLAVYTSAQVCIFFTVSFIENYMVCSEYYLAKF